MCKIHPKDLDADTTHTHSNHIKLMLNKEGGIYTEPRQIPKALTNYQKKNVKRAGCGSTAGRNLYRLTQFFSAAVGSQLTTEFALLRQTDAVLMRCYVIQAHRSTARSSVHTHRSSVCSSFYRVVLSSFCLENFALSFFC